MNKTILFIIGLLCFSMIAIAIEPSQQTNKLFLEPFYRATMNANTNYTYNVDIRIPDGMNRINMAIITIDAWITPTVNYQLWVNGQTCNNPTYTVSTTYAGAGHATIIFDCSNIIREQKNYTITLRSDKNSGSSTGWLDITYTNKPNGALTMHGTEYVIGDAARVWLQLVNSKSQVINNGTCFVDIYKPDKTRLYEREKMLFLEDGVYYFDFIAPSMLGVYPAISICYYDTKNRAYNATNFTIINGILTSPAPTQLSDLWLNDNQYTKIDEVLNGTNYTLSYNTTYNLTYQLGLIDIKGITIEFAGKWNGQIGDDLQFYIWNFSTSNWLLLLNTGAPQGGTEFGVTNTILTDNLTNAGLIDNNNLTRLLVTDNRSFGDITKSNLQTDLINVQLISLNYSDWKEIRGSSELHISNDSTNSVINYLNQLQASLNAINATTMNINDTLVNDINNSITLIKNTMNGNFSLIQSRFNAVDGNLTVINNNLLLMNDSLMAAMFNISNGVLSLQNNLTMMSGQLTTITTGINNITTQLFVMNSTLNNHTTKLNNLQSDINDIQSDINDILSDTTYIIALVEEINTTTHNLSMNINLTDIQNNLSMLIQKCNNLTTHINNIETITNQNLNLSEYINITTYQTNSSIIEIQQNLTAIYYAVLNINSSNLSGDISALNDSLTGLIVSTANTPRTYTTEMLFLIIFVVLIIAGMFINSPVFTIISGMYGVIYGLILMASVGFWFGLIVTGVGVAFGIYGFSKAGYI